MTRWPVLDPRASTAWLHLRLCAASLESVLPLAAGFWFPPTPGFWFPLHVGVQITPLQTACAIAESLTLGKDGCK